MATFVVSQKYGFTVPDQKSVPEKSPDAKTFFKKKSYFLATWALDLARFLNSALWKTKKAKDSAKSSYLLESAYPETKSASFAPFFFTLYESQDMP